MGGAAVMFMRELSRCTPPPSPERGKENKTAAFRRLTVLFGVFETLTI